MEAKLLEPLPGKADSAVLLFFVLFLNQNEVSFVIYIMDGN